MARPRVVLNRRGVRDLLRSSEVGADLRRRADRIAAAAGPGYVADDGVGRNRARASVRAVTMSAMRQDAEQKTLLRSLDAGR